MHVDWSEAAGALLRTNPKLRHSLAGGALSPVLIEASIGVIDKQKRIDVDIGYRQ